MTRNRKKLDDLALSRPLNFKAMMQYLTQDLHLSAVRVVEEGKHSPWDNVILFPIRHEQGGIEETKLMVLHPIESQAEVVDTAGHDITKGYWKLINFSALLEEDE